MNQADLDNHANQLNPDHEEYWHCREQPEHCPGSSDEDPEHDSDEEYETEAGTKYYHNSETDEMNQADLDNHANQLNPDHEEYWHCREQPFSTEEKLAKANRTAMQALKRPKYHIIDHKTIRWGVEYDENTRCGYPSHGWPKDKPFVLPMDIDVWETCDAVEISFPEEWLEGPAIKIQRWWKHVKRYREKNACIDNMNKALQTFNEIRRILNPFHAHDFSKTYRGIALSQLKEKFVHEIISPETAYFRCYTLQRHYPSNDECRYEYGVWLLNAWKLPRVYCCHHGRPKPLFWRQDELIEGREPYKERYATWCSYAMIYREKYGYNWYKQFQTPKLNIMRNSPIRMILKGYNWYQYNGCTVSSCGCNSAIWAI